MVMLVVAFVSFSLFNFVGDPINNMVGEETSDEERAELRETLGLTDPIYIQFSRFVVNASKGNFGISYQLKRPVSELISEIYGECFKRKFWYFLSTKKTSIRTNC